MRVWTVSVVVCALGCGSSNSGNPSNGGSAGNSTSSGGSAAGGAGGSQSGAGNGGTTSGGNAAGGSSGSYGANAGNAGAAGSANGTPSSASMELISDGVPSFASTGSPVYNGPGNANDMDPMTAWGPGEEPAWLAYDLSGVAADKRNEVLVVWNAMHCAGYVLDDVGADYEQRPLDYTIEINSAAGGGDPPSSGWTNVATVTGATRSTIQHEIALAGGNWVRFSVSRSSNPSGGIALELDVYSIPEGATDSWLLMGDSITYISMPYPWCDVPQLVHAQNAGRFPAVIDAALGGTNTSTAMLVIDDTMSQFAGRYVALAYGTNDHANEFQMEGLVQKVIAAGKVPVVPHMIWSDGSQDGVAINMQIDALYQKYPEILPGPDLWAAFEGRTDLIPTGDVHPNGAGQEELRKQWANMIAGVP